MPIHAIPGGPGCFDELEYAGGQLRLSGWLLDFEGETQRFHVRVGTQAIAEAVTVERADVGQAFEQVPHASRSGFAAQLSIGELPREDWLTVEVIAECQGQPRVRMAMLWRPAVDLEDCAPPPHLMLRVASVAAPRAFKMDGLRTLEGFVAAAREHGIADLTGKDVLEWGCGPGRVLEHLVAFAPGARIAATDVDREAVEWCTQNLASQASEFDLHVCGYNPPLPWPDDSFDLIVAHSVMTHLPAHQQVAWSHELGRVLRPGGLLLTTTLGRSACDAVGDESQREVLAQSGLCDDRHDAALDGVLPEGAYRTVFQTPEWTSANWTGLEVVESIERAGSGLQDLAIARPRAHRRAATTGRAGRPILVTSAHRCGTTFVGRMLDAAAETVYVQEPFNPFYRDDASCSARFERFFTWIHGDNERPYLRALQRLVDLRPNTLRGLVKARGGEQRSAVLQLVARWREARQAGQRALLKDPIALLSAPWLAQRFDAQVVVVLRHPAGFVSSVKRLGWQTALWDLVEQPGLGEALFPAWLERAKRLASREADIIDQAATFWAICFELIDDYRRQHPDWIFVHYEDLCEAPEAAFRSLYWRLGLTFTDSSRETIERFTSPENPSEVEVSTTYAPVDSKGNAERWRERLTSEEIARVHAITGEVADRFYASESWSLDSSSE